MSDDRPDYEFNIGGAADSGHIDDDDGPHCIQCGEPTAPSMLVRQTCNVCRTEMLNDAAPDLLAACRQLLAAVGYCADNLGYQYGPEVGVANRAIAKAEGK